MLFFIAIVMLLLGFVVGANVESNIQNPACVRTEAVYEQAVRDFKKDLRTGAGDELLMTDEYRKFERYMVMQSTCK